jgi:alginate O-acetyltransferase complex protein AlgI
VTAAATYLMLCSLLGVALVWALPRSQGLSGLAILTFVALSLASPESALWLGSTTLITALTISRVPAQRARGKIVLGLCGVFLALMFGTRELDTLFWIGGAYFTLRHMHALMEWWMGRLEPTSVGQYFRYSFFLPVIMAGPIHRLGNFQRQVRRQSLSSSSLFSGAERALFGLAQAVVISGWALRRLQDASKPFSEDWPRFHQLWLEGVFDWLFLFFSFSGLTSLALGISMMMGLKLEENFNRPWAASNLIDFWTRWHMTLSHWCRDYVFYPITAVTRLPIVGLLLAMLAMGLWHDNSAYYVLWAVWQSIGIYLTHAALRLPHGFVPVTIKRVIGTASVFLWLSLTRPVATSLLEFFSS